MGKLITSIALFLMLYAGMHNAGFTVFALEESSRPDRDGIFDNSARDDAQGERVNPLRSTVTIPKDDMSFKTVKPNVRFTGIADLTVREVSCNQESTPYMGTFYICPVKIFVIDAGSPNFLKEVTPEFDSRLCLPVYTNSKGQGLRVAPIGKYRLYAPDMCLPGQMCIMSDMNTQVWNGFEWKISPEEFILEKGKRTKITAIKSLQGLCY